MRFLRSLLLLSLLLGVSGVAPGCTGFRKPTIELESVELGSIGFTGGTLLVNVSVSNPNAFGARTDHLRYELFLRAPGESGAAEWRRIASGIHDEEVVVGPRETRVVQVPVDFRFADLGAAGSAVLRSGRVDYRATGVARVRAAGVSRDVPFRRTGSVMVVGR
jgi:LEA14-like dessication related protein